MLETILALSGLGISTGIGAGIFYKMGKLETKMNFLFDNCDITIKFKGNNKNP